MRIRVKTTVGQNVQSVKDRFSQDLFLALNPPFPKVDLLAFGGCKKGDVVSLKLYFPFFSQIWTSHITEDSASEDQWLFVDEGVELPFFLKKWKHNHIVEKSDKGSAIIDDIEFSSGLLLVDLILYPGLMAQFLYRKPIYRRWFKQKESITKA
ncbi:MAG: hypothetical protein JXR03_09175 [Cyclobacteriaceae bacterium]